MRAHHAAGRARTAAVVGWDLAHAAGNVPLRLHDWDVDFAAWCSYKYLNAGPGAVAGCFVHERHARDRDLPRLAGWWGNDPATRFRMRRARLRAAPGADGWQLSQPADLRAGAVLASLELFDEAGMAAPARASRRADGLPRVGCSTSCIGDRPYAGCITPREPARRGCQLSLRVQERRRARCASGCGCEHGVVCDFREPDVDPRCAPVPLYIPFHDVWRAARGPRRGGGRQWQAATTTVTIVGAGLAGPLLPCLLAQRGIDGRRCTSAGPTRASPAPSAAGRSTSPCRHAASHALHALGLAERGARPAPCRCAAG